MSQTFAQEVAEMIDNAPDGVRHIFVFVTDDGAKAGIMTDVEDQALLEATLECVLQRVRSGEHRRRRRFV